jgi:hypothetical protein
MLIPVENRRSDLFIDEEVASSDVFGSKPDVNKNETNGDDEVDKNEDSNSCFAFIKPEFKAEVSLNVGEFRDENICRALTAA